MTKQECAIVMAYTGTVMLTGDNLGHFYRYVENLLGHPVMTHELANRALSDRIRELASWDFVELCRTATEVRLVTEADFQRPDADPGGGIPCWKETKSPTRRNGWAVIVYGKWLADRGVARYWTGKPDQAQMEETPWQV